LAEKIIALGAANNIWNGTGIKAQNKPTAKALEIDFRLKLPPICRKSLTDFIT
jgi:hypothetical protein